MNISNGSNPIFEAGSADFKGLFNRRSFQYRHSLSGHPLFELPRLATLAETLLREDGPSSVNWRGSDAKVNMKWGQMPPAKRHQKISEAIADLENSGSWLLLYRVQTDPEYRALMESVIAEVATLAEQPLASQITWKDAYIFLASPSSVTPYHIDHESTFLFQIHGQRTASIWDREDRSVLPLQEVENYYAGKVGAANYRQEIESKASVYTMTGGTGVHHPVLAPHTFKNGSTYSIALGVHFCLREWDLQGRVHQVNACLRRLRMQPTPPRVSAWRDGLKSGLIGMLSERHPKTKGDMLRSGFRRLTLPLQMIPGAKGKFLK